MYGMAKEGLGPAVGAISIPILSFAINSVQAAAIILPAGITGIVIVSFLMGLLKLENLMTSLVLMPLAPIGVTLGHLILNKVEQKMNYRFLYIALFLSGIKLIYDAIS